jgi:GntR family transcriptional regulator, transcriptional repressor for pyruvate dehydrogenase complex
MAIRPVTSKKVSEQVLDQLKDQVIRGRWPSGSKIPSEARLTELFGVSRVSVREAIHKLVGMGVLCIRRGEGTYVNEILAQDYFETLLPMLMIDAPSLEHMLEFRAMIEVGSARLAAQRAGAEDLARMRAALAAMEAAVGDRKRFSAEDLAFHTAVAVASRNGAVVKVTAVIHDMLEAAMEEIVRITGYEGGLHYHRRILAAIEKKDEKEAARVMAEHIGVTIDKVGTSGGKLLEKRPSR